MIELDLLNMIPRTKFSRLSSRRQLTAPKVNLFEYKKLRGWWPVVKKQDNDEVLLTVCCSCFLMHYVCIDYMIFAHIHTINYHTQRTGIHQLSLQLYMHIYWKDECTHARMHESMHTPFYAYTLMPTSPAYYAFSCYRVNLRWSWSF